MTARTKKTRDPLSGDVQEAVAALLRNTHTTSRPSSLVEIEKWLSVATIGFGGMKAVADRLDLSEKMLRQFTYIRKLSSPVQDLFAARKIDSVDAAVHLSQLTPDNQHLVARALSSGRISTSDLRVICDLLKRNPRMPVRTAMRNVRRTRNIRHFIAEFVLRCSPREVAAVRGRFESTLGKENVLAFDVTGSVGRITLNTTGRLRLLAQCRLLGVSKRRAILFIAEGGTV